jgi:hypothetical protein
VDERELEPINEAIIAAIFESIPPEWTSALLTLDRDDLDADCELGHTLSSGDGRIPAIPADSLFEETYKLDQFFQRYGLVLTLATYRVDEREDGSWHYRSDSQRLVSSRPHFVLAVPFPASVCGSASTLAGKSHERRSLGSWIRI